MSEQTRNPNPSDSSLSESDSDTSAEDSHALEESNFSGSALDSHLTHAVESDHDPIDDVIANRMPASDSEEKSSETSAEIEQKSDATVDSNEGTAQFSVPAVTAGGENQSAPAEEVMQKTEQNFDLDEISRQMEQIDTSPPWMPKEVPAADVKSPIPDFGVESASSPGATENAESKPSNSQPEEVGVGATTIDVVVPQESISETASPSIESKPANVASTPVDQTSERTGAVAPVQKESQGVPSTIFMAVLTYASVVTLICVYLVMQSMNAKPHELESLPDIKPPMKDDEIAYRLAPENAPMPKGHTLKIGESQRFGNIRLTPLKVSYEKLQFEHFSGDATRRREPDGPVLKLWLKFENVSKDQTFSPLDRKLMLIRIADRKKPDWLRSNNFICSAAEKNQPGEQKLIYDLEMSGDWNFDSIPDDMSIGPGEELKCYLPSEPVAFDSLNGPMVWRVQIRKGYHPESFRGVTTLIEVEFDPKEIKKSA